jgi:hypothetical protein
MTIFCGDCDFVSPKENHPKTHYHECTKYTKRLYHNGKHPNLYRDPVCTLLETPTQKAEFVDDSDI